MTDCDSTDHSPPNSRFPRTRWSLILGAQSVDGDSRRTAVSQLCKDYWTPLYLYIRKLGRSSEDAEDIVQGYFARILDRDAFEKVSASGDRGKFRSWLLTGLKNYLVNDWRHRTAEKRGGGIAQVELDVDQAERIYASSVTDENSPDLLFEKRWALSVLDSAIARMREEYAGSGKEEVMHAMLPILIASAERGAYAEPCARLGMSEASARVIVHRMRKQLRIFIEEAVADTTATASEAKDELLHFRRMISR